MLTVSECPVIKVLLMLRGAFLNCEWKLYKKKTRNILITIVFMSFITDINIYWHGRGRGNSTVGTVSVGPGSLPARSTCHRKVEFYHCVIDSLPPVPTTG